MIFFNIKTYIEGHSWVFAILDYNSKHKITLNVDHGVLTQKRCGNRSIMSLALAYFTKVANLRAINMIRLSFQVNSLSDFFLQTVSIAMMITTLICGVRGYVTSMNSQLNTEKL